MDTWDDFAARMAVLADLRRIEDLLGWDQSVTMPPGGVQARQEMAATLAAVRHEKLTDPALGDLIATLLDDASLDATRRAVVDRMAWKRDREVKIPAPLASALAEATARGQAVWEDARAKDDFSIYEKQLQQILDLKAEEAQAIGAASEAYDVHLDGFERGLTTAEVEGTFTKLASDLQPLLDTVLGSDRPEPVLPDGPYDGDRVFAYCRDLAGRLGFDYTAGRIDLSTHPFTGGTDVSDVRITTRLDPADPVPAILATVHEVGHALYEQGIPRSLARTVAGTGVSMAVHESQSRLWENHIGRSRAFWAGETGKLAAALPPLTNTTPDDIYRYLNRVKRSLVRVDADELTYPLHIIVRFELELGIARGELQAADLPSAWDDAYERRLGIRAPSAKTGVLQDIHWSFGAIGYFPTYLLGSVYAAQLFDAMGDVQDTIRAGDLSPVLSWLRERLHRHGAAGMPREIMARATERPQDGPIDTGPYLASLTTKFEELYA